MADPQITTQDSKDPFANLTNQKLKEEARKQYEENRLQRSQMDAQRNALSEGSDEWWRITNQMQRLDNNSIGMEQRAQGINPQTGKALAPEWANLVDPSTGLLKGPYQASLQGLDPSQWAGYEQFKGEATRGPGEASAWANLQNQNQGRQELMQQGQANQQAQTAQSQALSNLAMRGGYGSGARTALARDSANNMLNAGQNIRNQGIMQRFDIANQDEQNRQKNLQALLGMEQDTAKFNTGLEGKVQQYNIGNAMSEIGARRNFEQEQYLGKMREYGAKQEADAAANSGGGK